jgi:ribosomal protein S18 acetylase RimI-like enzyme
MLDDEPEPNAAAIGVIFFLVVSPEHRGQGIARALLDAACDGLKSQGLAYAQARPRKQAASAAENHLGPLSMYLAAGFSILREDDEGNVYVQKRLV